MDDEASIKQTIQSLDSQQFKNMGQIALSTLRSHPKLSKCTRSLDIIDKFMIDTIEKVYNYYTSQDVTESFEFSMIETIKKDKTLINEFQRVIRVVRKISVASMGRDNILAIWCRKFNNELYILSKK